ncbi:hypothetical protein BDR04DRAFT_1094216 [Suillus decipiens]|nr:hypothetical protein BDR04DRAFT_1094216 [Suillus decipiens]
MDTSLFLFFITSLPSSTHILLVPIPYNNFVISSPYSQFAVSNQYSTLITLPKLYSLYHHSFKNSYHLSSPFYSTLSSATPLLSGSIFT